MNMKTHIKTIHGAAILATFLLIAVVFISQVTKQLDSITLLVQPSTQLAAVTQQATLSLSPSTNSVSVDGTFDVNILLNTGGQSTYGVDINRLNFDKNILQVVDMNSSIAGTQITAGTLMLTTMMNSVDNTLGTVQFSQVPWDQANSKPTTFSNNAQGTLATVRFRAIKVGTANVSFDFTSGSSIDSNISGIGSDLLSSVSNGSYTVTAGNVVDTTAPVISATSTSGLTQSGATIKWTTDDLADSQVLYGKYSTNTTYPNNTTLNSTLTNSHTQILSNLEPNTDYYYKVSSTNIKNLNTKSTEQTFRTLAPIDNTPPTISNTKISVTASGATITWDTTDEVSDTQVEYALSPSYANSVSTPLKDSPNAVPVSTRITSPHTVIISNLSAGTEYYYKVKSRDTTGNLAESLGNNKFTTEKLIDTTKPTAPLGIVAVPTSETEIQLSWTASTDPTGDRQNVSGIAGYNVYRGSTLLNTSVLITTTAYKDTGLTPGATYSYQIEAVDRASPANISSKSSSVSTTTPLLSKNVTRKIILVLEDPKITKRDVSGTIEFLNPANKSKIHEANITTDASGQVIIDIPENLLSLVHFRVKIKGYLSRLVNNVDLRITSIPDVIFPNLPSGDFDGNQIINSLDFSYMNTKWGKADLWADIDKNGLVNTLDFSYMSKNWLLAGE
jgi:hypothetical protein